jgi:cell division protease FtsH
MVTEYGMSNRIGPMALGKKEEMVFLGREIGEQRNYSEQTAREIDEEVRSIITSAFARALAILTEHKERLIMISEKLIREETLEGAAFEALFTAELLSGQQPKPPALSASTGAGIVDAEAVHQTLPGDEARN